MDMSDYQPITWEKHGTKCWNKLRDYRFASKDNLVALSATEAPRALMWMPLAFLLQGETITLVGLEGLVKGHNQLVDQRGVWIADYVPAVYRSYPFKITGRSEQSILCIDESSGLISDDYSGQPFFDQDGKPAPALAEYLTFLGQLQGEMAHTQRLSSRLAALGLLDKWLIELESNGRKETVELLRVNEERLNQLSSEQFLDLRSTGALLLAYCQLLSMQNVQLLKRMAKTQLRSEAPAGIIPGHDDGGTISFNWDSLNQQ
jgi:hypothetical protein